MEGPLVTAAEPGGDGDDTLSMAASRNTNGSTKRGGKAPKRTGAAKTAKKAPSKKAPAKKSTTTKNATKKTESPKKAARKAAKKATGPKKTAKTAATRRVGSVAETTGREPSSGFMRKPRNQTQRTHLLNVPYEERETAKWGGARWDGELRRWKYTGEQLPHRLARYGSVEHSPERWFEDEYNQTRPSTRPGIGITLRPHQEEAAAQIAAAAGSGRAGFLLADDVGLGKTYSVIEGVCRIKGNLNVLVLAPLSVVPHWRRSITMHGDGGHRWCVTNYDRAKGLLEVPEEAASAVRKRTKNKRIAAKGRSLVAWDVVICDEAHRLKNPTSQRSAAVRNLIKGHGRDAFVVWMSATAGQTPLELAYLAPLLAQRTGSKVRDLQDFESWCREYGLRIKRGSFGQWGWERNEEDLERMRELLFTDKSVGMRRRPQDLAGWPEVVRALTPAELDPGQRELYEEAWEEFCAALELAKRSTNPTNPTNPMVAALRFRQKASLLRVDHTAAFAADLLENGLQVAISTQFLDTAEALAGRLGGAVVISGESGAEEREERRIQFQQGRSQVAIFTVTEGISLHAGEAAVRATRNERALLIHDLRWSALDLAQIEGRCHRDGEKAVAYYMYGEGTVEEKVAAAVIGKLSDMGSMLGDDTVGLDALLSEGGWSA